jgi:serine/threonine-protein kinase
MGIVYLATHTRLGRRVAIKVLRSEYSDNPQAIRRFFAEARAVNKIAHHNIVEVTDFVERPGETNYYVMELLEGTSLAVLIDAGGVPTLERSIPIMQQLAEALAAVHRAGIVHRDIKPDNVVLIEKNGKSDFVKLCDFGVAKLTDSTLDRVAMHSTSQGAILGTPEYMSPEQASGKPVDLRTDIYSFGVMLYEMATGRVPFSAPDFGEMVVQLLKAQPIPPSQLPGLSQPVPKSLERLILHCLAKDPAQRPQDMELVAQELEQIAEQEGLLVYELNARPASMRTSGSLPTLGQPERPTPPPERPTPPPPSLAQPMAYAPPAVVAQPAPPRSRRNVAVIAVVALVAIGGGLAFVMTRGGADKPAGETTTNKTDDVAAKVEAELKIADERIASGRLVAPGGDEALDHLLSAKALDPKHAKVNERLGMLARKFEQLAEQAIAAGSLAEAAAHLQTVLLAEPENEAAAKKMAEVEQQMLEKQNEAPDAPDKKPKPKK